MAIRPNQITDEGLRGSPSVLFLAALLGVSAIFSFAFAQTATNDLPLTLTAAVEIAVSSNPVLTGLRAKTQAMQERPAQAKALPNPMLTYSGMDAAEGGRWPDTGEKRLMVQQEFPWFGKRELRERIAAKDAEASAHELDAMTRELVMRVKETYFDLYAVRSVIAITRDEQAVIRQMVKISETQYATGSSSQADVIKAQTEITMLKQKLLEMQAQENTLKAKLNTLLNRRADEAVGPLEKAPDAGRLPDDAGALFANAAKNRHEVLAAQMQIERYGLEKKLMEKEHLPDYKLGLEYRSIDREDDMIMATVSVELPIRKAKYQAAVREAEKMVESSQAAREAAERQSALDVQDASFKLRTARRTLDLYRNELVPQAEARFKASEAGYRTGKSDFLDFLESERFLLNAKTMVAMTEGAVGMQTARLEWAACVDLAVPCNDRR